MLEPFATDLDARGTLIVQLAAKQTKSARHMLLLDRKRIWRKRALAHLESIAAQALAKGATAEQVNDAIALRIALEATDDLLAAAKRAKR